MKKRALCVLGVVLSLCLMAGSARSAGTAADLIHVLEKGESIWSLSHTYLAQPSRWRELQQYNGVRRDRALPPGTPVRIPIKWLKQVDLRVDVISVTGQAQWTRPGLASALSLAAGTQLKNGDRLLTQASSYVTLQAPDGSILQVGQNSALTIRAVQYLGTKAMELSFRLDRGRVETLVVPVRNPDSVYEIRTPVAQLGVRGTRFRVAMADDQKSARAEVEAGKVAATNPTLAASAVVDLDAGFGTVVREGQAPLPPVALLPAADLGRLQGLEPASDFGQSFDAVTGATAYFLQLARDSDFRQIVTEQVVKTPAFRFSRLADGRYHLRVRALDALGIEGREARAIFTVRDLHL